MTNQAIRRKLLLYYATTLFSILFAIVGFSYNAWRLEQSEYNASVRVAAFSMLSTLAEFEQVVFANYYDNNLEKGNPRTGWGKVILMEDLASLMAPPVAKQSKTLKQAWQNHWQTLPKSTASLTAIEENIDLLRQAIKSEIKQLN